MSAPLWMPLYVADYLGDTGHLSTVEHGAYMLLIMHYWQHGGLPDDEEKLARIVRLRPKEWSNICSTLADLFLPGWRHKRIDAELAKAQQVIDKRRAAGRASAEQRANKSSTHVPTHVEQVGQQTGRQPQPQSQPPDASPDGDAGNAAGARGIDERETGRRGTRLASDWQPSGDDWKFAANLGLDPDDAADEFRDYWKAIPGSRGIKLDWSATFRNRCREIAGRRGGIGTGRPVQRGQGAGGIAAALSRVTVAYPDDG